MFRLFGPKITIQRQQQLTAGGMAVLWQAEQPDGTRLIIRELKAEHRWKVHMHRKFLRGAAIRDRVSPHPGIVYSVEYGYWRCVPFEVIEFVPGVNLNMLILRKAAVVKTQLLDILRQACNALAHIHQCGYLHLDIKAENFMVNGDGAGLQIKLTDFDLARPRHGGGRDSRRSGTADCMAPEQLKRGISGVEADIFGFGVLAYYLVTGRKPFAASTEAETRRQQVSDSFLAVEPVRINPELTPKLNKLIMRCLEKNPATRFPNMGYLASELERM